MRVIRRSEAKALGLVRYFTGKPCSNGHIAERYISKGCTECIRDRHRSHPNKPAWNRAWLISNREKQRRLNRLAYERNKPAAIARNRKRKARLKGSNGAHTDTDIADIFRLQLGKCAYCRVDLNQRYHVDHIMPLALGGSNARHNLQLTCELCNSRKGAKDPLVFARKLGLLL